MKGVLVQGRRRTGGRGVEAEGRGTGHSRGGWEGRPKRFTGECGKLTMKKRIKVKNVIGGALSGPGEGCVV